MVILLRLTNFKPIDRSTIRKTQYTILIRQRDNATIMYGVLGVIISSLSGNFKDQLGFLATKILGDDSKPFKLIKKILCSFYLYLRILIRRIILVTSHMCDRMMNLTGNFIWTKFFICLFVIF
jgi:hypothetical protein